MGFVERFKGLVARGNGLVAHRDLVARGSGLLARRGLLDRAIGVRWSGFAVAPLERRSGFQSAFLTMAVRLIPCGAFFSVFGGLGNCIGSSEKHKRVPRYELAPLRDKKWQILVRVVLV